MKTKIIILSGFILAATLACNNLTSKQNLSDKKIKEIANHPKGIIIDSSRIKIDTTVILSNQNLIPLIDDLDKSTLIEKNKIKDIPPFIKTILNRLTKDNFSIANPGEKWQATDVILEELPARQLIYLGIGDNITLLTYYTGGVGKSEHILIFKYQNKQITDFWCGNVLKNLKTKTEIINFLRINQDKHWGLNTNHIYF